MKTNKVLYEFFNSKICQYSLHLNTILSNNKTRYTLMTKYKLTNYMYKSITYFKIFTNIVFK